MMTNRVTVPQGYHFDYVQEFAKHHGIESAADAVQLIISDHARLLGVDAVTAGTPVTAAPRPNAVGVPTSPLKQPTNDLNRDLFSGLLPKS